MVLGLLWARENCGRRNGVLGRDEEVKTGGFEVEDEARVSGLLSGRQKSRRRGRSERKHTGGEGRFKGPVQVNRLVEPAGPVQRDRSGFLFFFVFFLWPVFFPGIWPGFSTSNISSIFLTFSAI